MKQLTMLATVLLLSSLLVMPVQAAGKAQNPQAQANAQAQVAKGKGQISPESEGRRLHRAYFQKREAMRKHRDAALELRESNVSGNKPGHTGM